MKILKRQLFPCVLNNIVIILLRRVARDRIWVVVGLG